MTISSETINTQWRSLHRERIIRQPYETQGTLMFKKAVRLLLPFLIVSLVACSKLTQKNYDKIQVNMPMDKVIAILGEPTSTEHLMIAGMSGTSAVWKDTQSEIDIQFLNDQVIVKSFSNNEEEETKEAQK